MKCPNPKCKNTELGEKHAFCFDCGSRILETNEEASSPSVDDKNKTPTTNEEDSDVQGDSDVSHDGGQRKRKDEGEQEGKPAKRKSVGNEDDSNPDRVDDITATALQNLQLAKDPPEVQQGTDPATTSGLVPTTEHPLRDSSISEPTPIKQASNTGHQPTARESSMPEVGRNCESETLVGAPSSSSPDGSMQQNQEEEDVWVRRENWEVDSKSNKSTGSTATGQSNEDDMGDSDSTSGLDSEEDEVNQPKDKNKRDASRRQKSASKIQREKKQDKKKRREAEKREAFQKEIRNGGSIDENSKDVNPTEQKMRNKNSTKASVKDQKSKGKGASKENKKTAQDKINNEKSTDFEGFGPGYKDKMTIIFHAVLAPHFSFEENFGDRIFMRFGGPQFGNFNSNVLELKPVSILDHDFLLLKGEIQVPFGLVSGNVSYKYIVLRMGREKGEEEKHLWERIVHAGPYKNRCLCIPKDRCHIGAIWHQYDDAIFSEPSRVQSLRNMMPVWKSMDVLEGRNLATWAMLNEWEDLLTVKSDTTMAAWDFVMRVGDLAYCMTNSKVEEYGLTRPNVPSRYNFKQILRDYLKPKIEQNASLQEVDVDEKTRLSCLVSAVAICHVIISHKVQLDVEDYHKLFKTLSLWSDNEVITCSAFNKLLRSFPDAHLRELGESIQAMCRYVVKNHHHLNSWLFAVPLAHFLTQESEPFNAAVLLLDQPQDGDYTWWGAGGFETKAVRERTVGDDSCPSHMIKTLDPLFALDPLFRRTFLLVVPCQAFARIAASGKFTALEMCVTLARILQDKRFISQEENGAISATFKKVKKDFDLSMQEQHPSTLMSDDETPKHEAVLCANSCLSILKTVFSYVRRDSSLLYDCLEAIEMCTATLKPEAVQGDARHVSRIAEEALRVVKKWLKQLLSDRVPCYNDSSRHEELTVWTKLFALCTTNSPVNEMWRNQLVETFTQRLEERNCNDLVELFTKTNMSTYHHFVQDLVSEVTFKKVERMLQTGHEGAEVFKNITEHGLASTQASKCGELLTLMIQKCWPQPKKGNELSSLVILKHLLTWSLWPCFLQRFGKESDYRRVFKDLEDGQEILMLAISSLEAVIGLLKNGAIEVQMLLVLKDYPERFLLLCEHISKDDNKSLSLRNLLNQRCIELNAFQGERENVSTLIRMCSCLEEVNLHKLSEKVATDASRLSMKDLVQPTIAGGGVLPVVTFFGLSSEAKEMISVLSDLKDSILLREFWKDIGCKALKTTGHEEAQKVAFGVEDVVKLIWIPSFEQLQSLQQRFLSGVISFGEVDKFFSVFKGNQKYEDLTNEIRLITSRNDSQGPPLNSLIDRRIRQIEQYHKLHNCIDAARIILDFKNSNGLEGNFEVVEDLLNQMHSKFKQRQLKTMNAALQEAGRQLSRITPDDARCLEAVTRCQRLIDWLKETISGPQELKVLVDLAIISAGETDMETARITCLHTSCLGFAPLIFDLKRSFGFDDLMKTCEPVWAAVDADPTLPTKLEDTSRHMDWLQSVKTSHGSVAMSSLMEAKSINEHGIYSVGCHNEDESSSLVPEQLTLPNVIKLRVSTGNTENSREYTLDDLMDLQSKLMLIAAKASHGKQDVDRFVDILQCVLRLATVYISLCNAGEVSHLKWKHEFQCKPKLTTNRSLIDDLVNESEQMEQCLQQWKDELHTKRLRYSELNHFTTRQLLFLRRKLAIVQGRGPRAVDGIPLEVYNLLESVLPGIDLATLKTVLTFCGICSQEDGQDIIRSYGASSKRQRSDNSDRPKLLKEVQPSNIEIFQSLVAKLELIGYSEEVAIAAMISCKDATEADLIVWSVQNGNNEDLITAKYLEAQNDPRYLRLMDKDSTTAREEESPVEEDMTDESGESSEPMETAFSLDQTADGKFLSLDDLGKLLLHLASQASKKGRRRFPRYLKRGKPNFVVVPKDDILGTVLSLYMHDSSQSLPTSEEVLICTSDTTTEEIELLWRRSLGDHNGRLFCLVNVDLLDYTVSQRAADTLEFLRQEPQYNRNEGLSLVVICSSENEDRAHMAAALDQYRLGTIPHCASPKEIRQYLKTQFKPCAQQQGKFRDQILPWTPAAALDKEGLAVRVLSSEGAGAGKSLVVCRLSQSLPGLKNNETVMDYLRDLEADAPLCITVPIYGPFVHQYAIAESLLPHTIIPDLPLSRVFHLDVHPSVKSGLDTLLFNLLVLGVLESSSGHVWRRRPSDLYVIELTPGPSQSTNETTERRLPITKHGSSQKVIAEPFYRLLPTIHCGKPMQTLFQLRRNPMAGNSLNPLFDNAEFQSSYVQRAFQYLKLWESAGDSLDHFWFLPGQVMGDHAECIETLTRNCGIEDPSWAELRYFVNFLNSQLQACEESSFCNMDLVGDTLEGFRSFVVRFMILMSRDFATPSLNSCERSTGTTDQDSDANGDDEEATAAEVVRLSLRRRWETSSHPYIFFNQDRITMTFVGFHIDQNGNLIDPDLHVIIQQNLMSRHLRTGLFVQKVDMETNYESWSKGEKIEKLCGVMGVEWPYDPDDSYELTTDNLKKILAIHMRFRCGIPVVIMGETGCGKTCLIRYMCGLQSGPGGPKNMLLMKVHGGTTYKDIEKKVEQAEEMARVNEMLNIDTVLFFDEANTTDALGMIKEVMVDRRVNGRKIGVGLKRLQFIAACNPYRKHTEEMIHKLESAGLGYHVATQQTHERLGHIPLRHLVYRVHALPESMRPLVWDFGQLNPDIEELYTRQIVSRFVLQEKKIPGEAPVVKALTAVLTASQHYMRDQTDECSFVSLRDVERAMNVMVWFYNHREVLNPLMDETNDDQDGESDSDSEMDDSDDDEGTSRGEEELNQALDDITRALVLSLGVCYQARLQDREPYRRAVARSFSQPCQLPGGHHRISQEISRCQRAVLNQLELGHNIARNTALSENVFMMVVCIELRIPLFVVGKPGSSKSLAKTVVADNMEGDASRSDLFKTFKQVHMVSYQCSPLSTAEGIMATFRQCSKLQKGKNPDKYVSVVVLDEIGLAEDSPLMPLKTLHPLLEDGVSSADDIIQVEKQLPERVAFIGISNWALDPAKMNRGIMLSRGLPDAEELVESAMGICSTDRRIQSLVAPLMNPLARGYEELYKTQEGSETLKESKKDEFFGLRDFYSLVKMVYKMAEEHRREPSWAEVEHAIRRNFGGLDEIDPVQVFRKHFRRQFSLRRSDMVTQNEDAFSAVNLIKASLERQISRGESRYLLVLTENYAALPIVQEELLKKRDDPVIIFGSSFPKDQEYTQVCRNINRIKVCMETGRTVILLNLESLYESLYDALNQYYVYFGGQKFVDLGLGSHRVKCRVHDAFRLIVIAERDVVYSKFPIPLINRLEKHYLVTSASLSSVQAAVVIRLQEWVTKFSCVNVPRHQQMRKYSPGDAFVGYHGDTAASVVLQVCSNIDQHGEKRDQHSLEEEVYKQSQELLLQCATPDAVARLQFTQLKQQSDKLWKTYFTDQEHSSLTAFLRKVLTTEERRSDKGTLIQVTTHSRLLSSSDLQDISSATSLPLPNVACLSLQQFHTEQQFCSSVRDFFAKLGGREGLLLVQCDAGDLNCNLIPCARHLLVEQRTTAEQDLLESVEQSPSSFIHIVLIVQLPRLVGGCPTFVGFQGGRWLSIHIDELRPPTGQIPAIQFMVDRSVSELFDVAPSTTQVDDMEVEEEQEEIIDIDMEVSVDATSRYNNLDKVDIVSLLRSCVQAAVARIDDESCGPSRSTRRIELMLSLLPDCRSRETDLSFATILARRIHELLQEKDERAGMKASDWLRSEALSGTGIQENGTFRKALWQRVYSSVIPILSEVIAVVDRDSNLELVTDEGNWLSRLWIQLFQSHSMVEFHYDAFLSLENGIIRERVPVITAGRERQVFELQFPFSWLIKEKFDGMWRDACSIAARTNTPVQQCLQDLANASEMGKLLEETEYEGYEESAVLRYLHDFVHMVHKSIVPEEEQLISQAIVTASRELHTQSESSEEFVLTISLIHVAYDRIEKRLTNFCHLVRAQPDIVTRLLQVIPPNESELVLDAVALQLCLSNLEPTAEEFSDPQTRFVWCNRVLSIRSSADNMISNLTQYGPKTARILQECKDNQENKLDDSKTSRSTWQRVSAVRLFIEHTCPGTLVCHPADIKNVFKLWKALGDETDFTKPHTMRVIEKFLVDCSEAVSKRYTSYGVNTCPVCLEGLAKKDPVKMPCGHVICLVCVSNWIERERTCPLCKQDVPDDFKIVSTKFIRKAVREHYDFRRRCNSFFMELVSLFCFGANAGDGGMDPELFAMFMSYVTEGSSSKTKDFSPFPEHGIDATPVVRSFLLQQLLRTGDKEVKDNLAHYLSEARGLRPEMEHLLQVCQLFVHCWEDSLISLYSKTSGNLLVMIKLAQQLCDECTPLMTSGSLQQHTRELDVAVLEGVAKARYVLALVADFMYKTAVGDSGTDSWNELQIRSELEILFEGVRRMCCEGSSPVPRLYLLKQLVRRYGAESINVLCGMKAFEWIVPPENRDKQQEDLVPDRFVIYGEDYKKVREAMAKTVLSASHRELTEVLQSTVLPPVVRDAMMLLSEYREVTTCYGFRSAQRQLSAKAHKCLQEYLKDDAHLSARAQPFAFQLLDNTQGAAWFPGVRVAPGRSALEQNLAEIVIHTTAVLQCIINQMTVCEPLRLLMDNPAALMNAFFPTMPDDNLQEAMAGMRESGSWYQCPKGHPYYIGDCGRPVEVKVCPECKVNIGGAGYQLSQGNTTAQRADRTMTGHLLGHPSARPKSLAPERNLSPVVVGIIRILMHCAMIEGACRQPQGISALINPRVPPEALPRFLWDHLRLDVELLASSLGRSIDDTVLCIHMVLVQMTAHLSNPQQAINVACDLKSKESRRDWETAFNASVVTPVLTNLEEKIQRCLQMLVGDKRLGNNPLMRQLYEVDVPLEALTDRIPPTCPALWRYRTQVTLDHFSHTFQQEVLSTDSESNKILAEFLREEHKLRALRFLPDIVKLQRLLMDKFHRRIDRAEAEHIRIRDFLRKIPSKTEKDELASLIASFNLAWNHVRLSLDQQGRLRPPADLCEKTMDNTRPLALLLPSTSGMGICSTALVFFLTTVHNEFNERYQNLIGGQVKDLPHIQLQDVTSSNLISYHTERDLLPLILAQCNYSLEVGRGTLVQYNWEALERQLIDRFIRGRPLVDFKDERFAFSKDIQLDSVFASVKAKVHPQVPLNSAVSHQILGEFRSLTDICDVLSSLDIAIGFLSSTGGSPDMLLNHYLQRVLRMPHQNSLRSLKAQQCCQLRHVISLWRLLTLERARLLMRRGEDPFEQIADTYKQVMSPQQMIKFSNSMKRINLDRFVSEVLELILLNLRGDASPGEEDMSLSEYIQWHLDNKEHEPITGLDELRPEVQLKHVINAWQTSVELWDSYHEKRDSAGA